MKKRCISIFGLSFRVAALAFAVLFSCSNPVEPPECTDGNCGGGNVPGNWTPELPAACGAGAADPIPDSAIVITYSGASAEITSNVYVDSYGNMFKVNIEGGHVAIEGDPIIKQTVNIVLSGTTSNGSFKVDASKLRGNVGLYLNGVNITNPTGPAINIQKTSDIDGVTVHLVGCGNNILSDGASYATPLAGEQAKGTFFSEGAVTVVGSGSLEIRSKGKIWQSEEGPKNVHAMVIDNHFTMNSGNVIIHEAQNDGIHVNRNIAITGGNLQIKSTRDAIQNERDFPVIITGGKLTLWTTGVKSHGIACDSNDVTIYDGADIKITVLGAGAKGIRSRRDVEIKGGTINIETYGGIDVTPINQTEDGDTSSSASGVRAHNNFKMSAGNLTIKSNGDNSKGINADGGVTVSGGAIIIGAVGDGIKTDGDMTVTGGNVTTKSTTKKGIDCKGKKELSPGTVLEVDAGGGF